MKHSNFFLAALMAGMTFQASAQQTARLEVIHNSADAAAETVDIYVNGGATPFIDDFQFRTTSGFVDVPAGAVLNIGVAPSTSTGPQDIIATVPVGPLTAGESYIAIANGIVSPTGYNPAPAFGLDIFTGAREIADGGTGTNDVLVYHGSTDAPAVNVEELAVIGGAAVTNLSYGEFQGYLGLGIEDYLLQIQAHSNGAAVTAFDAPLATLGLDGAAITVLASGFLDPMMNSNGAGFGLWVSLGVAGDLIPLPVAETRVEIIHNSSDAAAASVDVFINGDEAVGDFNYRTSTGFITLPAGMPLSIDVAPANAGIGSSVGTFDIPFLSSKDSYVVVANGIVSPTGYMPAPAFNLDIFAGARETASSGMMNTDVLVYHGATDAPAVDVEEVGVGAGIIVNDLAYNGFNPYLELGTADYILQVQEGMSNTPVAAYNAPLATLGLQGAAVTVLASGFLDPSMNNNGEAFGLFVSTGTAGDLLELPRPMARVEVIHNAAAMDAATVDLYLNDEILVDDFDFRTSTGFVDLPAKMPLKIDVAPGTSTSVAESLGTFNYDLDDMGSYILVANGIVGSGNYNPATPFDIYVTADAREAASMMGNTDVLVFHGSTDAPTVDVAETGVGAGTIVDDLAYGEFDGYLELGTADYELTIQDETGAVDVATFQAPLSTLMLDGAAITVLASGFLDPTANENGAIFGLWVSLGTGGGLIPLSNVTGIDDVEVISSAGLYPNPANDNATLSFELTEGTNMYIDVINSVGQSVYNTDLGQLNGGNHIFNVPASEMVPGFYFVNLTTDTGVVSTKMQVLR